jgi:hypothetical protein
MHDEKQLGKDVLDTVNSFTWFAMDASWMLELSDLSLVMIVPTVASGFLLCFVEKRANPRLINVAILSWICMNVSWMLSEVFHQPKYLFAGKVFFGVGVVFILLAAARSKGFSETFSHFRRFRFKKF